MKSSAKNIQLTPLDDLFKTEAERKDDTLERVRQIPIDQLFPFKNHPFQVRDDEAMKNTVESVKLVGVLSPAIARPRAEGGYELVSGHRRRHACELAGRKTMPVIVRDLDDDAATILIVDRNLQRETILPSERAFAFKMKLDAMKRQAGRPSKENATQVGQDLRGKYSVEILGEQVGESRNQVQRFIRLTYLAPELLQMVDDRKIAFNPAVELSFLKEEEQEQLLDAMEREQSTPSLSQAQRLKKFSQEGKLSADVIDAIMSEEQDLTPKISIPRDQIKKYFPASYTPKQMQDTILKLLEQWQHKWQRDQEMER
ncbi:MAG: ParB/RepB/Spo0J family partition protein [Ethanoligenens sp.]